MFRLLVPLSLVCLALAGAQEPRYEEYRTAAVKRCEAIDWSEYQTGLWLNPEGYRSYYVRSQCLQDTAVRFRDARVCAYVRRRLSLGSSSWGYSESNCRALVKAALETDRRELQQIKSAYQQAHMTLRDFTVALNGNGRDFEFLPRTTGERGGGYRLQFDIVRDGAAGSSVEIHSNGYYVDPRSPLHIFVRRADIQQRMPDFTANRPYAVRAKMTFGLATGPMNGFWAETFTESVFPLRDRTQSVTKQVVFPGPAN